jgi:hypothetical protein
LHLTTKDAPDRYQVEIGDRGKAVSFDRCGRLARILTSENLPYKSNPTGESIYTEYASAWDGGFMSVATMRAREGTAASECEEKATDNMPVTPGSAEDASAWDSGPTSIAIMVLSVWFGMDRKMSKILKFRGDIQ